VVYRAFFSPTPCEPFTVQARLLYPSPLLTSQESWVENHFNEDWFCFSVCQNMFLMSFLSPEQAVFFGFSLFWSMLILVPCAFSPPFAFFEGECILIVSKIESLPLRPSLPLCWLGPRSLISSSSIYQAPRFQHLHLYSDVLSLSPPLSEGTPSLFLRLLLSTISRNVHPPS